MVIGLDVGGTHIDAVIISNRNIIKIAKEPYEKENLEFYILKTLDILLSGIDVGLIKQINLSTTISTNAITLKQTEKVGMIIQNGPGLKTDYLKLTDDFFFISGYTDHRGVVVKDYENKEINNLKTYFKNANINSLGIATKFSVRNPKTENKLKELLFDSFSNISLSHELSGSLNFPRRVNTTYLNSAIYNLYKDFVDSIIKAFSKRNIKAPVYVLKADGGLILLEKSIKKPVETILSGPAASVMGFLSNFNLKGDSILLDIGGTTTDIFVVADGIPLFEPLGIEIAKYKTLVRSVYSHSIALGGDSSINIVNGKMTIGPNKEGKPFCLGGPKPTLTDAFVYKGELNLGTKEKAKEAIGLLAKKLSLTASVTADMIISLFTRLLKVEVNKVIELVNSKPVYTIRELLYENKIIPKTINLIGGPVKLLARRIEKEFKLKCYYKKNYSVANAVGAALSKTTGQINVYIDTSKSLLTIPELSITKNINNSITLDEAKNMSLKYLNDYMAHIGQYNKDDLEISFASSFNMVDGFYTKGKNMRITAQVKPGLIYKIVGDNNE